MSDHVNRLMTRWLGAGLLDEETAARIRAFEEGPGKETRLRWPIWAALAFGTLAMGAGVLLFVSAHWDDISPEARIALVFASVGVFHVAAAFVAPKFAAMATTLHALGTVACGSGVFLAGQVFNLAEHWPGGVLLWAVGAAAGWVLLRTWPQLVLMALLVPAWLTSEWAVATARDVAASAHVATSGLVLLALTYMAAAPRGDTGLHRRVLGWTGTAMALPAAVSLAIAATVGRPNAGPYGVPSSPELVVLGWAVAIGVPLLIATWLRGRDAWPSGVAAAWVFVLVHLQTAAGDLPLFAWWAVGAAGLVAWGVRDARSACVNLGAAIFAATVLSFYASHVMATLERSASLVGLGLLFLAGGWALERARRRIVGQIQGERS